MTFWTRQVPAQGARNRLFSLRALAFLLASAGAGLGVSGGTAAAGSVSSAPAAAPDSTHPVTAWAASVHAALAKRAAAADHRHVFTQRGVASWYGHDFAGRRTSSGVRFDPMKLTCAHRTLPLGTRLLVTSSDTGRSVVVTVNDRGPYAAPDRIIDLSRAAATRLGMVEDGLNIVTLRRVASPTGETGGDVEVAQAADSDTSDQAVAAASAGHIARR